MTKYTWQYTAILVILLGASLTVTDATTGQQHLLRKFIQSRVSQRLADGPAAEPDTWADPASSFRHLPTSCKPPPEGAKEADKVAALPGQPPRVNFEQYAGYVKVNEEHGRELFYYFVESPYDAGSKPLLLWLNGGPGCSSLGAGAMAELGPFRVNPDGKTLRRNKHSWNNVANVIFLESPAGVGFSYSNTTSDYHTSGDSRTAEDAYMFLLHWFERFPEYKGRDFYIAGESYSGHYAPQLATVVQVVRDFGGAKGINLKGIFVGNPLLDWNKNAKASYEFLWNHGVISDEVWASITRHCNFNLSDGVECSGPTADESSSFFHFKIGDISPYNIYAPMCVRSKDGVFHSSSYLPGYDPCDVDHYITPYFNRPEVKKALHARPNTRWEECNDPMFNTWDFAGAPVTMMPTISWLVRSGLSVWIYSGDMDDVCPITATRYSVKDLNLTITSPWHPWYTPDNEVGGYVQQYEGGFTFASVRGAGHLVPSFQPKRSLVLFYSFLKGVLPPPVSIWRP